MKFIYLVILAILYSCSASKPLTGTFPTRTKDTTEQKHVKKIENITAEPFKALKGSSNIPSHLSGLKTSEANIHFIIPAKKIIKQTFVDAWEVQVLAVSDEVRAKNELSNLKSKFNINGRIISSNNIFKVRVGSSETRVEMDQLVNDLKQKGYTSAWVVKNKKVEKVKIEQRLFYTLQVGVFSSNLSAINLKKELSSDYSEPIMIKFINGLYKIFLGKEENRVPLEKLKLRLRNKSVWITQQKM